MTIELFSATQPVARECGTSIPASQFNQNDPSTCAWDLGGGMTVFIAGEHCTLGGDQMGYSCYNNPSEGNYIFKS